MQFDMTRAWNEAVAAIRANREVMLVVAGVFFLLPSLLFSFLFADVQAQAIEEFRMAMEGRVAPATAMAGAGSTFFLVGIALLFVQMIGFAALLALLDDRERPTVGEALAIGAKSLPTLIGTFIIFAIGYVIAAFLFGLVVGLLVAAIGLPALAVVLVLLFVALVLYAMTRLSLTLAVIVYERKLNPLAALLRSWALTKGNGGRLFGFFALIFIVYIVISVIVSGILASLLGGLLQPDTSAMILLALLTGLLGAVMNALLSGLIAAIYRQLAGPSTGGLTQTFG